MVKIESAKSDRSRCNKCGGGIAKDTIRISMFTSENTKNTSSFCHIRCYKPFSHASLRNITGRAALSKEQKDELDEWLEKWADVFNKKKEKSEAKKNKKKKATGKRKVQEDAEEEENEDKNKEKNDDENEDKNEEKNEMEEQDDNGKNGEKKSTSEPDAKKSKVDVPEVQLPTDRTIWTHVCSFLTRKDLGRLDQTNKYLHEICSSEDIWRERVVAEFGAENVKNFISNNEQNKKKMTMVQAFKRMRKEHCIKCHKKTKILNNFAFTVCYPCSKIDWRFIMMTKKDGSQLTKLPQKYFDDLPFLSRNNPYYPGAADMRLYMLWTIVDEANMYAPKNARPIEWSEQHYTVTRNGVRAGTVKQYPLFNY